VVDDDEASPSSLTVERASILVMAASWDDLRVDAAAAADPGVVMVDIIVVVGVGFVLCTVG